MTKEIFDAAFGKRLRFLRAQAGLTQDEAAKRIGVSYSGLQKWEGGSKPLLQNIEKITEFYKCSKMWLLYGYNEPYLGAREKFPEMCSPSSAQSLAETGSSLDYILPISSPEGGDDMRGTKWSDDIAMAARILESRTPYATALRLNIQAFGRAMSAEQRISQVEQRVTSSESQLLQKLDDLTSRLQELETRNAELESTTDKPQPLPTPQPDKPAPPDEEKE